jgi:hypothetical protein
MSVSLIVWSVLNILLFGIPSLTYSILVRKGQQEHRNKAIIFNVISSIIGIAGWVYIIIKFNLIQ